MKKKEINIEDVIKMVDEWSESETKYEKIQSGITNSNWVVKVNGKKYFVRIPGQKSDVFIDRNLANEASLCAYRAGIGPEVLYYFQDYGIEINEWLEGYTPRYAWHMHNMKYLLPSIDILKKFHSAPPLKNTVSIFDDIHDTYERMKKIASFQVRETDELLELARTIENSIGELPANIGPCHNDLYVTNFMWNDATQSMKLIDYEYAANNDPCYDLGIFSGEVFLYEDQEKNMIRQYYGEFDSRQFARIKLYKIAGDIKWVFWSCIQNKISKIDFEYIKYAYYMLHRMKVFVKDPDFKSWLNLA